MLSIALQVISVPVCHEPASVADSQTACRASRADSLLFDGLDAGLQFQQAGVLSKQRNKKLQHVLHYTDHNSISYVHMQHKDCLTGGGSLAS